MGEWDRGRNVLENILDLGLCPPGMISNDLDEYIELEMVCETYKTPPVAGGVEMWPARLYDAFLIIRQTHQAVKNENIKELRQRQARKTNL
jgi:hypothetical protein